MLDICNTYVHVAPKAPKTSSHSAKKVPQGKNPRAKSGLKRKSSSKHISESQTEASKSKADHLENKNLSRAKDKSSIHPSSSTHVVIEMHKEEQQAASSPTSLRATSEERAHPQLSGGCDASADSTAEADPGKSAPNDSIPHQQGMDEGTNNYAPGHIFAGTNPSVLVDQTKSVGDRLKTTHTDLGTNEESRSDEISKKIKLEDLSDLMKDTRCAFFTPDSPQDEPIIVSDESEESSYLSSRKLKTWISPSKSNEQVLLDTLNRFASVVEQCSRAYMQECSFMLGLTTASPAEGEKNTILATKDDETTNLHNELVDLLGIDVVTQALSHCKYKGKMGQLKSFQMSKLVTYIWLNRKRMEYLNQTEKELKFDFKKPLKEQDPLNELNDLANKKRKRTGDLKDHSRSTKKHKSSVQHEEEFESLKFLQLQLFRHLEDWEVSLLQFMQRIKN
ncbi:hypothetical protein Tco_1491671 [Tanacetum coccineum]